MPSNDTLISLIPKACTAHPLTLNISSVIIALLLGSSKLFLASKYLAPVKSQYNLNISNP